MFAISLFATAASRHQKGRAYTLQSQLGGPPKRIAGMLVVGLPSLHRAGITLEWCFLGQGCLLGMVGQELL